MNPKANKRPVVDTTEQGTSKTRTPWAVHCAGDYGESCRLNEIIFLTKQEYDRQLRAANVRWRCPICGGTAWWDDANYAKEMKQLQKAI